MGNPLNALKSIATALGLLPQDERTQFKAYDSKDLLLLFGAPSVQLSGLHRLRIRRLHPRAKFYSGLGGGGAFLSNRNTSGELELTFHGSAWSLAHIEIFDAIGAPQPIMISDLGTGGTSTVIGSACRVVDIGDWQRGKEIPPVTVIMKTERLYYFHGARLLHG